MQLLRACAALGYPSALALEPHFSRYTAVPAGRDLLHRLLDSFRRGGEIRITRAELHGIVERNYARVLPTPWGRWRGVLGRFRRLLRVLDEVLFHLLDGVLAERASSRKRLASREFHTDSSGLDLQQGCIGRGHGELAERFKDPVVAVSQFLLTHLPDIGRGLQLSRDRLELQSPERLTLNRRSGLLLLQHVRQLVRNQAAPGIRARRVFGASKVNVRANCECAGGQSLGPAGCSFVVMHPHIAEVMTEARFHKVASCLIKWLTGRAQYFVGNGQCCCMCRITGWDAPHLQVLFLYARALLLAFGILPALDLRLRHLHHLFGYAVCRLLAFISRVTYRQLRLNLNL